MADGSAPDPSGAAAPPPSVAMQGGAGTTPRAPEPVGELSEVDLVASGACSHREHWRRLRVKKVGHRGTQIAVPSVEGIVS